MTLLHGFELISDRSVPELNTRARMWRHVGSGAQLLSLENDDENKVFGITFATPPADSTGIAHIMEHSVLCGSRKYPVKEPFVELLKGSLKTFLNAMTFPDKTTYPVASQNAQDLYNLADVYLDAVFYPNITPYTLKQEGWHYELDEHDGPLVYKGVVFNEMKGAYSDPEGLLFRRVEQALFPDTVYGVDSGGDPAEIPNLTYEQFKEFHDRYYHPSNALIYFYGDDDPEERLRFLDGYLKDFERQDVALAIEDQAPFDAPRRATFPFASGDGDETGRAMLTVNWIVADALDYDAVLALSILAHILIGTPASPLRKALIDSGLGEDLVGAGLEADVRQSYFSTGLKGVAPENVERVEALVLDTLRDLARDGIDPEMIEASVNTTEFALRENNTGAYPRGLVLMIRALRTWLYGGDPLAPLAFEAPLAALKDRLAADPRLFEGLIQRHLLDNTHRITVIMQPDPDLGPQLEARERARLDEARASMSEDDLRRVQEETQTLKAMQETPDPPEALATIPSLTLDDLDRKIKTIPCEELALAETTVLYHDLFTNGIAYLDLGFDLHSLPQDYLPYVSLFGRALLEMGAATQDYVKLAQRIGRKTGGIHPTAFTSALPHDANGTAWLFLRGKATVENVDELLAILRDVLLAARLDNRERFRQIVLEEKADQEASLVPMGHAAVAGRLKARFSAADWAAEQFSGIDYLFFLRELAQQIDQDWPPVQAALEAMREMLLNRRAMVANVTLDRAGWSAIQPALEDFLAGLPVAKRTLYPWQAPEAQDDEGLVIPAQVNYVGKAGNLYDLGYGLDGSSMVITNFLRATWLWERVRVHGGAYGGFCQFDRQSGFFGYVSYRDPNLLDTLNVYDQAGRFLRELSIDQDELVKSIVGAIGNLDAYQLPDAKGFTSLARYLLGETDEERQRLRDEVFDTTLDDFKRFGEVLDELAEVGQVVVLGGAEAIARANAAHGGFLRVTKVL